MRKRIVMKLLISADSAATREGMRFILQREGYEVVEASDIQNAIEVIERDTIDIYFIDMASEEVDSLESITRMSIERKLPVVLIVSETQIKAAREGRDLGIEKIIMKPFSADRLIATVDELRERTELSTYGQTSNTDN
ncbi:MAG: response regulator [Spirochaetales bacterium]|nr:response regulator [Spirochaetales bacterium]